MNDIQRLSEGVKRILATEWDPIGVRDVVGPSEEYERYALILVKMLLTNESAEALAERLLEIEHADMGLIGNADRALATARKLEELTNIG